LDLSEVRVPFRIALIHCRANEDILLRGVRIPFLAFDGSWVSAIKADGADVSGGVTFRNGFRAAQLVRLHRARIGVDLDCSGGTFLNSQGTEAESSSLAADGATFGGGVFLNRGFHAEGEVRLSRAHIRDDLDCSGGTFHNRLSDGAAGTGIALNADGLNVSGSIFLRGVMVEGEVRLPRAKVAGDIDCGAAKITSPFRLGPAGSPSAINMEGSAVGGNVVFNNQFRAIGFVTLRGAGIAGQFICSGATFENHPPPGAWRRTAALDASLANFRLGVFLGPQFRAEGEVRLQAAQIGTVFHCRNCSFINPARTNLNESGHALTADGLRVGGRLAFGPEFRAEGEVRLLGAQIEGDVDCSGAEFKNPPIANTTSSGHALSAHRTTVKGNVFIRDGMSSDGEVSFSGALIEGNLEGASAEFRGELNLETAIVKGSLMFSNVVDPKNLHLTLTNASIAALADEPASWPQPGNLLIDGLVYERFSGPAPKDSKSRLRWLDLQKPFLPQPYRQVAKVLREEGEVAGSVEILYEMEHRVRTRDNRWRSNRLVNPVLKWTVGYGYYPARAFWWLAGFVLLGFALYGAGYRAGSITPTDRDAYATFKNARQFPAHYERFHALIYSVENNLPFVKLGQVDHWQPDPRPQRHIWRVPLIPCGVWMSFAGILKWYGWWQILSGWVLGTLFIAGITGIIRRD
jgi:hypothetical protein